MTSRLALTSAWEGNPYPAFFQNLDMDSLLFTLRQQHDKTQAGDSTLHWTFLTQRYAKQEYTLGSLGKFVHPTYGLIVARFCKFALMNPAVWTGAPVGFIQENFAWEVTNAYVSSASSQCAGLQGSYSTMANGDFGWVIQEGVNLQSVAVSGAAPIFGDSVGWSANGTVAVAGVGKVGFVMNPGAIAGGEIPPGALRVKTL